MGRPGIAGAIDATVVSGLGVVTVADQEVAAALADFLAACGRSLPAMLDGARAASILDTSEVHLNNEFMTSTATFSTLLRDPNAVIKQLQEGDVLITRRGAEPLRLSLAGPAADESNTLSALAQLIAASLDDEGCDRIASHLAEPFPWIEFLPVQEQRDFVAEFLKMARACAAVARFDRLTILLAAWQATAEAYADPSVTSDGSDLTYLDVDDVVPAPDPRS